MRVAVVSTHPIQYQTPWFQRLAGEPNIDLKVSYALLPDQQQQGVGFDKPFAWDIPLLDGYEWEVVPNKRTSPGLTGFFASSTPSIHSLLKQARPDAVIITGWQSLPLVQALWAAVRLGIPILMRGESNALRPRAWWVRAGHRLLLSRVNRFERNGTSRKIAYVFFSPGSLPRRKGRWICCERLTQRTAVMPPSICLSRALVNCLMRLDSSSRARSCR